MKTFLHRALFCAAACLFSLANPARAAVAANTATFVVSFEPGTINYDEFAIEAKQKDGTWVEVASGPAAPITFTAANVVPGPYTIHVFSRMSSDHSQHGPVSDEASVNMEPSKPGAPTITVTVTLSIATSAQAAKP